MEGVRGVLYSPRVMDTQVDTWGSLKPDVLRAYPVIRAGDLKSSSRKGVQVRVLSPAPFVFSELRRPV